MRDIARLDEATLYAIGFDRVTVNAFRTILTAVQDTLPAVQEQANASASSLSDIESDQYNGSAADNAIVRALADIAADLVSERIGNATLLRRLDELQADIETVALANTTLSRRVADLENGVT